MLNSLSYRIVSYRIVMRPSLGTGSLSIAISPSVRPSVRLIVSF